MTYETEVVIQWIMNDAALNTYWTEVAEVVKVREDLKHALKTELAEEMPKLDGIWKDLLSGAIDEVDWNEVAEALIEK